MTAHESQLEQDYLPWWPLVTQRAYKVPHGGGERCEGLPRTRVTTRRAIGELVTPDTQRARGLPQKTGY
ncbi:hypothetical protein NDU88_000464 [Pleurodeles waltl]|uniref:Uncharacterized protein n=1 Tax=Pleurodeles waltl TaxID=8319 RepID=A0AAV7S720_PLEWA|nr:hypothetical protein NDU88_000464 [Pleurodeles waltl]